MSDCRWRGASDGDILWADWGGDHIAFHRPSGKSHLLNPAGKQLLTRILSEPLRIPEIIDLIARPVPGAPDEAFAAGVLEMLERFEHLGLVERV